MAFEQLTQYLDAWAKRGIPAGDCIVYRHHEEIYRYSFGFSDDARTKPLTGRETYFFYSATKLFTCTAALQLIEQEKMGLDDPVWRYLPAYAMLTVAQGDMTRAAKTPLTIRHLMSMQSGLDYDVTPKAVKNVLDAYGDQATTRQIVDAFAHKPLTFDPGADWQYSLSHDVLAALIEVVSGERFGQYLKRHIMDPLGIEDMGFTLTQAQKESLCALYLRDAFTGKIQWIPPKNVYALSTAYESGGAGLMGRAGDYALLLDALACGGVGKTGARILKPETIDLYRTPQLTGQSLASFQRSAQPGYNYGLGVRVMSDREGANALSPNGEFGWNGAAGAYALVDPAHQLSLFYVQHVRGYDAVYHEMQPSIRDLTYEALAL